MAKKIVLFLSEMRESASVYTYACPDGGDVTGAQTNEAPVLYLLRTNPDVAEIICIVTQESRNSAWEHFEATVKAQTSGVHLTTIPFENGQDFSTGPLPQVMSAFKEKDEILLETTGGPRNAVMDLLLLSRILSYKNIPTVSAVYSNWQERRVEDISHLIHLFDLVGGMQELTSLGSVRTLRTYYGAQPEPKIDALLNAMEQLTEAIILCRTRLISSRMDAFDVALREAEDCTDPMMRQLLPAFRAKFGKKLSIPALIKWCVQSDMLQQALTVYTERIPEVIFKRGDLLQIDEAMIGFPPVQEYEDPYAVLFMKDLLMLSARSGNMPYADAPHILRNYAREHSTEIVRYARTGIWCGTDIPWDIKTGVENLAVLVRAAYADGTFCHSWPSNLPAEKQHLQILAQRLNELPARDAYRMVNHVGTYPADLLWTLLERKPEDEVFINYHAQTVEYLAELLPGSGYKPCCSVKQLQAILQDYLYIKALRNMTNHANHTGTATQNDLMEYLRPYGYKPLGKVTLQDLKDVLNTALRHLQTNRKKEWKR